MSAIIDNALRIRALPQVSIVETKSQSGKRQAQRRGPVLYNFEITIIPMLFNSERYLAIEDEILDSNYSELVITTKITNGLTKERGLWTGSPVVNTAGQSGNSITISGASVNRLNWALKGDYVQFSGYTKVFQLTANANSSTAGLVTLNLNGAIPSGNSPASNSAVTFGEDVEFRFAMVSRPEPTHSGKNLVSYSVAAFEEVIG